MSFNRTTYDNCSYKQELQGKWKELFRNYFSISESKKSSKNIFHTAEMNHYLREKIKLNFNNSGVDIKFLVPISSIVLSGIKSTQYAVTKSSRIYSIFNYIYICGYLISLFS